MTVGTLGGELQQLHDGLRREGERIASSGRINDEIRRAGNQKPDVKQLSLAVETRDANPADRRGMIHQITTLRHRQFARVGRQPSAARGDFQQKIPGFFIKTHGADNAANFHKLTVLLPADQLLKRHRLGGREGSRAQDLNFGRNHNRRKLTPAHFAFHFDELSRLQWRIVRGRVQEKINARRVVLEEAEVIFLVEDVTTPANAQGFGGPRVRGAFAGPARRFAIPQAACLCRANGGSRSGGIKMARRCRRHFSTRHAGLVWAPVS